MKKLKKIPQEEIGETLNRNCLTTKYSGSYLRDLVELCENVSDNRFYELIPIRLVAYLEDVLRVKYEIVLRQQGILSELFMKKKLQVEMNELIGVGRLPLSIQLAYSFGCNNLDEICNNIILLTDININDIGREKMGNDAWGQFRNNIDSLFRTRHLLCHESGVGVSITHRDARMWIQNTGILLNVVDDAIINSVYKDFFLFKNNMSDKDIDEKLDENIRVAKKAFEDSEKRLDGIFRLLTIANSYPKDNPNLEYITKWKDYRDLRVASDNVFPEGSKQNLLFSYREKNQYNEGLLSEIRLQHRDFLNYINNTAHDEQL